MSLRLEPPSVPLLTWLRAYRRNWLRTDLVAGVTVWALVAPQAIAYAHIAKLPPQAGLAATCVGLLVYAVLGTSRQLIVSPTSSTALLSAALVAPLAMGNAARVAQLSAALAMLCGALFVLLGVLKLGFVSQFITSSVQVGILFGLGLTIIAGQLVTLLGMPSINGDFLPQARQLATHLGSINSWTAAIGLGSLALLTLLERWVPRAPRALIVVVAGLALSVVLGLAERGVHVIGDISGGLLLPVLPQVSLGDLRTMLPGAAAILVIAYAEGNAVAEDIAAEHRDEIQPDQELIAIGVANGLSSLFQGFLVGGGASQSAANDRAGAQTQVAGLVVAVLTLLTAIVLLPLFRNLPNAVLGAVVINAVWGFLNVTALRHIWHLRRASFALALLALSSVLLLGILPGLITSILVSVAVLLSHISRPKASLLGKLPGDEGYADMERERDAAPVPGLLIFRLDGMLVGESARPMRSLVRAAVRAATTPVKVVLLDLEMSNDLDVESLDMLAALCAELRDEGIAVWLARADADVRAMLERGGLVEQVGAAHVYRRIGDGVRDFLTASAPPSGGS